MAQKEKFLERFGELKDKFRSSERRPPWKRRRLLWRRKREMCPIGT